MTDVSRLTTPILVSSPGSDEGRFVAHMPDGWQQGRGIFGGLVLGTLARALAAFDGAPERSLRSLTGEMCGPVPAGEVTIRVERLRTGSGVATLAARIEHGGEVPAHAVGVFGKSRGEDTDFCDLSGAPMPAWREVAPLAMDEGGWPAFARWLEFRPTGSLPFASGPDAVARGWVRFREPGPLRDAAFLVAMVDAWWPALFARWAAPRPVATMAFTAQILGTTDGLDPEAPLFHSARSVAARAGYAVEMRELYGEDGRLLALNQQTFAIIK
jgi:hypothetical protein